MSEPILCYVKGGWAYFTTQALDKQWGDDWNDAPYEHNAGEPYEYRQYNAARGEAPWQIVSVAFGGPLREPCEDQDHRDRSVQEINNSGYAWLISEPWANQRVVIRPGTPLGEFIRLVESLDGGVVYLLHARGTPYLWEG